MFFVFFLKTSQTRRQGPPGRGCLFQVRACYHLSLSCLSSVARALDIASFSTFTSKSANRISYLELAVVFSYHGWNQNHFKILNFIKYKYITLQSQIQYFPFPIQLVSCNFSKFSIQRSIVMKS